MQDENVNESIKQQLEALFNNLFENKLIFNERVTILCELVKCELHDDRFKVELKPIIALDNNRDYRNRMYKHITSKPTFTVSATYTFGNYKIFNGKRIGRPYCPFVIFADPTMVEKVCKLMSTEIPEDIFDLLWKQTD